MKYLGYFCRKICCQYFSKIAQSGHTVWENLCGPFSVKDGGVKRWSNDEEETYFCKKNKSISDEIRCFIRCGRRDITRERERERERVSE